eukprot:gnl/TRDRNA2_/TRDRNA2_133827_c0_seq1.p1 gnl/TRDRNA2_/TRDRNA2_133827_c0~~gnl/TRDRNA2_/TRDRNA2_133827_c0_seq1.p1  ORF type:complete len:375 (-),score=44.20 gnl/TRDRNA2_/TRDRNA2_133827_c0_seq1:16-1140(-)
MTSSMILCSILMISVLNDLSQRILDGDCSSVNRGSLKQMSLCTALVPGVRPADWQTELPRFQDALDLFVPHMPCEASELRRIYLRLALRYHPDKCPEVERIEATQLFQAIASAYEELLKSIEPAGERIRATRVKTPAAAAAELGDVEELRRLLEELPTRATEEDELGACPLVFAAIGGCRETAKLLLDFQADIHAKNAIGWPAVLYAALHNDGLMVQYLLSRGACVTPHDLVLVTWTGNPNSLEVLLDHYDGCLSSIRAYESMSTLLHLACQGLCVLKNTASMHAACVDVLLTRKVPVDAVEPSTGRTCLQEFIGDFRWRSQNFEASEIHMFTVEGLCMHGASVTAQDLAGNSALSLATDSGLHRLRTLLYNYL